MSGKGSLVVVTVGAVGIIAGLLYYAMMPVEGKQPPKLNSKVATPPTIVKQSQTNQTVRAKPSQTNKVIKAAVAGKKSRIQADENWYDKLASSEDRELGKRIQAAQDGGELQQIIDVSAEIAAKSKSSEVRQAAVDALLGEGETTLPVLKVFLSDANEDVADSAYRAWDDAIDTIEDDKGKLVAVKEALSLIKDEDHIKTAVDKIEMLDKELATRELAIMAKSKGMVGKRAKECFESLTGREWTAEIASEFEAK